MQIGIKLAVRFVMKACHKPTAGKQTATPSYTRSIGSSGGLLPRRPGAGGYWKKKDKANQAASAKHSPAPSQHKIDTGEPATNFGNT